MATSSVVRVSGPTWSRAQLKGTTPPLEGLDEGGYFDLTPLDVASDLRRETVLVLEGMGIEVASSHHEGAPSQHEIDLLYTDALTMADHAMTYRLVVKEIALKHGINASTVREIILDSGQKPELGDNLGL